jgi:integrase
MACIRKRRGKYVVDCYDHTRTRRWITCDTKREAEDKLSEKVREIKLLNGSVCADPDITVVEYFSQWIEKIALTSKPRTADTYADYFRIHILPEFGDRKIRDLHRARIKKWLVGKLQGGYAKGTIRLLNATLRAMLNEAVEDGIIVTNPSLRLGKALKVDGREGKKGKAEPKAFSREQLSKFLEAANRRWYPYFLFLARTGVRLGESLAAEVGDINFTDRVITIDKAYSKGTVQLPKDGESRDVDLSKQLVEVLKAMLAERRQQCFAGGKTMPELLFPTENGGVMNRTHIWRAILRTLKKAQLDLHFSPHSFRHTFASQLLQLGESPAYVQRQLGHSSIKMTVDTYGKWLPSGNKAAVDKLDRMTVSTEDQDAGNDTPAGKVVAKW